MMKNILLALLLLSPLAFAQERVEFKFSIGCKVTDLVILGTQDGIPKRYDRFDDDLKPGVTFSIDFEFKRTGNWNTLRIDTSKFMAGATFDSINKQEINKMYQFTSDGGLYLGYLGLNYLAFESLGSIEMNRYFKNDWQLMSRSGSSEASRLLTANCQSMPNEYEDVYNYFNEFND